jgi:hypothetical protein
MSSATRQSFVPFPSILFAGLAVWGCASAPRSRPVEFDIGRSEAKASRCLSGRGALAFESPGFGGLSGIRWLPSSHSLIGVTDMGKGAQLDLILENGALRGVARVHQWPLRHLDGRAIDEGDKEWSDAEAIETHPQQGYVVSFERRHRLWHYAQGDAPLAGSAAPFAPLPPEFGAPDNGGVEAMARLANGHWFIVAEDVAEGADPTRLPAFVWDGAAWSALTYVAPPDFAPTDFAPLPGGGVLALERAYSQALGPRGRLVFLPGETIVGGAAIQPSLLLEFGAPNAVDNLEGLAVKEVGPERVFVVVASDDNFNPEQQSLLLAFELDVACLK